MKNVVSAYLRHLFTFTLFACVAVSFANRTFAQDTDVKSVYRSATDELLNIEKVSVLPFSDNLQGIYSRPLEAHLIKLVEGMHRWDYVPATTSGPVLSPEELESDPKKTLQVTQGLNANAFFVGRASQGPNGVSIHLSLFLTKDGKLISQALLKDYKQPNLEDLKNQLEKMVKEITARLPYAGRVLSREGNRVTVNLGVKDGLQPNQMLNVIQVIQVQRHPKFNFLVRSEKEILGRIKILKVEDTLSFGMIVNEKERGTVQKHSKIGGIDFVAYDGDSSLSLGPTTEETLADRDDGAIAFGKNPKEWQPQSPATFGQVGGRIGFSQFRGNRQDDTVGGLESSNNFAPSVAIDGELWITPEWTFHVGLRHGIVPVDNPRENSTPTDLNQSMSYYEAGFGYRVRLGPHLWSPYIEPGLGFFTYKLYTDDANPQAFTTMQYSGLKLNLRGAAPLGENNMWGVGGIFATSWRPTLRESPVSSGDDAKNNMVQFGVFGYKRMGERLKAQVQLDFEMYSSNFTGTTTASSASQRFTTLSAGIQYMF